MARPAVARETVCALRRQIASIEGRLADRLAVPGEESAPGGVVLRRHGLAAGGSLLATGVEGLDAALGGGLPKAALTEIVTAETRNAGAAAGFVLALAALAARPGAPLLWIGTAEIFREAGFPYAPGLFARFGFAPESLLFAEAPKLMDCLWIGEEAAGLAALSAVVLELRGNPAKLDLTATRRLHHRVAAAGRPFFLLRDGALAEPTAAPVRLCVGPAPAGERTTLAGPLARSIGPPAFRVEVDKSPLSRPANFILEWNVHERRFSERRPALPGAVVPASGDRPAMAPPPGSLVAFGPPAGGGRAAGGQPPREQHPAHRRPRRAG